VRLSLVPPMAPVVLLRPRFVGVRFSDIAACLARCGILRARGRNFECGRVVILDGEKQIRLVRSPAIAEAEVDGGGTAFAEDLRELRLVLAAKQRDRPDISAIRMQLPAVREKA